MLSPATLCLASSLALRALIGAQQPHGETGASAAEDAVTLIRRVIEAQDKHQRAQRAFAFRERTVTRKLESDGTVSATESESFLVTPSPDGEYRRLIATNGEPLSAADETKQRRKLEKHIEEQLRLSAEQRELKTEEKLAKRVERYRSRLEEALEVYRFEPLPDDTIDGQPVRVFRFTPKAGYEGRSRSTKILARMEGTIWIDSRRDQLAKLSLGFTKDLAFLGGVFGRVSAGTRAVIVGTLQESLWMLDDVDIDLNARLYFLKRYRQHISVDYGDYRRFEVDTLEVIAPPATSPQR
jgi:hypothetical protein